MNASRFLPANSPLTTQSMHSVTRKMLHERTCDIARRAGRTAPHVTQEDYEQAKRELTGDPQALIVDTTIDDSRVRATETAGVELAHPTEIALASRGNVRNGQSNSHIFFGNLSPLSGTI